MENLREFIINNNPLLFPPPEIVTQGTKAILAFLREQKEACRRKWISKMILVGEGGVGKTCLLKALRGEEFHPREDKTDGIWIDELLLNHPSEPEVTMQLKTWDFGGQHIYHATHQFFFTESSLYVLVWNARVGYEQSKLEYWLTNIQAKAPDSPILLVATHIDQNAPDLPFKDLQTKFPGIINQWHVSSCTGQGIPEFKEALTQIAANPKLLPHMGERWPKTWLDAVDCFRSMDMRAQKCIPPEVFEQIAIDRKVKKEDVPILARWLHELGDILYFQDVDELKSRVILNPQWVTDHIFKVLDSPTVRNDSGILKRQHLEELWKNLDTPLHDLFLNLMEQFDLTYQTRENKEISIIVEHLKYEPTDYEPLWNSKPSSPEITMKFRLGQDLLPGIPTWFIARAHRFTTHNHWRLGGLFADEGQKHLGLVQTFPVQRYVQLKVRGPYPQNFFTLLKDILDLTLRRYKGLEVIRTIPCPGHNGEPCQHEFRFDKLLERLEKNPLDTLIECQASWEKIDILRLLNGLSSVTYDNEPQPSDEISRKEQGTLRQREYMKTFDDAVCPRLFTIDITGQVKTLDLWGRKLTLQLYCEEPGHWHSTGEAGRYTIHEPKQWIQPLVPYTRHLCGIAKYVVSGFDYLEQDIQNMEETLKLLELVSRESPEYQELEKFTELQPGSLFSKRAEGADLRPLKDLLNKLDPDHKWGGLRKVPTPQGQYLWLCDEHAKKYR